MCPSGFSPADDPCKTSDLIRMDQAAFRYSLVAGIQEFTKIQIVPHCPPTCCTGIALPHHRCELAVVNLPILKPIYRLIRKQQNQNR
jgi:hypothetical protein